MNIAHARTYRAHSGDHGEQLQATGATASPAVIHRGSNVDPLFRHRVPTVEALERPSTTTYRRGTDSPAIPASSSQGQPRRVTHICVATAVGGGLKRYQRDSGTHWTQEGVVRSRWCLWAQHYGRRLEENAARFSVGRISTRLTLTNDCIAAVGSTTEGRVH